MSMTKDEALKQAPVIGTKTWFEDGKVVTQHLTAKDIYKDPEQPEQERTGSCPLDDCDGGPKTHGCWAHHCEWKAQPEQEPVAWYHQEEYKTHFTSIPSHDMIENGYWQPLYATPSQRTWVGLTDEEILEWRKRYKFSRALLSEVEAKLKEKNT